VIILKKVLICLYLFTLLCAIVGCSNTNITPEITEQISVTPPQAVPTLTPTPITDMVETGVINQKDVMLGNNPTNFIYNGLIAKDNDWIYFPTYYLDEQVGFGRINAKGEDFSYVTSTETVYRDLNRVSLTGIHLIFMVPLIPN
jgi:hypothetical protein